MPDDRPNYVVCGNVRNVLTDRKTKGSTVERASYCDHLIWVSPEARAFRPTVEGITVCGDCFARDVHPDSEVCDMPGIREAVRRNGMSEKEYDRYLKSVRRFVKTRKP